MNILFVDDEPAILRTIKRTLRKLPADYRIDLEADPVAALQRLQNRDYDLVVTDMRMPRLGGQQILKAAAHDNPRCVRAVLSGYSGETDTAKAVQYAHLFIGKPFEPQAILNLIERAEALAAMPLSDHLRQRLGALKALPPIPDLFVELTRSLADVEHAPSLDDIAAIVGQDISLATKVLQLANSAFFSGGQRLNTVEAAVKRLGTRLLTGLVLQHELFNNQPLPDALNDWRMILNQTSLATAELAGRIADLQGMDAATRDDACLAGLLHDIGRLVLAGETGQADIVLNLQARAQGAELCAGEEALLGAHHGWVGAYLLRLWGFPEAVIKAVAWHHHPSAAAIPGIGTLTLLHAADGLISEHRFGGRWLDRDYLARVGCLDQLTSWGELLEAMD